MQVAVFAVDDMFDTGLTSVLDILNSANALSVDAGLPTAPFNVTPVGIGATVRTALGLTIATVPLHELDRRPDVIVMPALGLLPPQTIVDTVRNHPALDVIAELCDAGVGMAAACSGTFFLGEAGILDGVAATTCWWLSPTFRSRYPAVDLDDSQTLTIADNITTAGAAFAHIDLALSLVRHTSPTLADLVARYLVLGDRPSQAAVAMPAVLARGNPVMREFERHIRANLSAALAIGDIAAAIGVSERTLQRTSTHTTGLSPARFIQEVRLDQATFLLRSTDKPADVIADAVGYRNVGTLRSLVRRRRGVTLTALRR